MAQDAEPAAKIQFDTASLEWIQRAGIEIVPVVFITNESLVKIPPDRIKILSTRIGYLTKELLRENLISQPVRETQIDCDWTAGTRDKYVDLLNFLKTLPVFADKKISATIRLYQCKYSSKTGIPPVSRGLLMCYNMGNLKDPQTSNSILDVKELKKYIGSLKEYPLPLDIALPVFEWKVLFRNNQFAGLISNLPDTVLTDKTLFQHTRNHFELNTDTVLHGYEFKKGDLLRVEKSNYTEVLKAAEALTSQLKTTEFTVSLYHLDSISLSKYKIDELENLYNRLR